LLQKILFDSEDVLGVEDGFDVEEAEQQKTTQYL
jgi:hypothetical protein